MLYYDRIDVSEKIDKILLKYTQCQKTVSKNKI